MHLALSRPHYVPHEFRSECMRCSSSRECIGDITSLRNSIRTVISNSRFYVARRQQGTVSRPNSFPARSILCHSSQKNSRAQSVSGLFNFSECKRHRVATTFMIDRPNVWRNTSVIRETWIVWGWVMVCSFLSSFFRHLGIDCSGIFFRWICVSIEMDNLILLDNIVFYIIYYWIVYFML